MSFSLKQDGGQNQQFADGRPQWQPQHGASGGGEDRARPTPSLPAAAHRSHSGDLDVWI
jgi:hypothetical protein